MQPNILSVAFHLHRSKSVDAMNAAIASTDWISKQASELGFRPPAGDGGAWWVLNGRPNLPREQLKAFLHEFADPNQAIQVTLLTGLDHLP
jgi:hypothetical protein